MRNKITKVFAGLAALAALALGGAALASAGQGGSQPAKPAAPATAVQQGPAKAGVEKSDGATAADTDSIEDENGKDDATEQPGSEQNEGSEKAESGGEDDGESALSGPTADKAIAAALKVTGGGEANAVERDSEKGATYEVEVRKTDGSTVGVRLDSDYQLVAVDSDSEQADAGK